jgi:Vacuole effluxer Atg22 like
MQRSSLLVRKHGGMDYFPSRIRYVLVFARRQEPSIDRGLYPSSSFIGPLVIGLVADLTGNIRYAFLFLVIMLWAALPVLAGVDVELGRADVWAWSSHGNEEHEVEGGAVVNLDG